MSKDYFKSGTWNALCGVCGFKFKADELKKRWDGIYVCEQDWEPRHILDFFKVRPDHMEVPWSQPDTSTDSGAALFWTNGPSNVMWTNGLTLTTWTD